MASMEDAVAALESILKEDLPGHLKDITTERKDSIKLEPIYTFEWEEVRDAVVKMPAALLIGVQESDNNLHDQILDARILTYIIVGDRSKKDLTKKLYRYAEGLRRCLRSARNRTLRGVVISAKVERVAYSPVFVDRDNLYSRDLQADIVLRVQRGALG